MRIRGLRTLAGLALCALAAAAQNQAASTPAHPDFSGEWQTDPAKSVFGKAPENALTWKIEHKDPALKLSVTYLVGSGEERTVANTYSTDGKETSNTNNGLTIKSVAKLDGNALTIESRLSTPQGETKVKERWTMSEDRRTLTMSREMFTPLGDWSQKLVCNRVKWAPAQIELTPK